MQTNKAQIVLTAEDLTADMIRDAADRWPEWISSERSANALGLPENHTRGGLPVYPPHREMYHARVYIARVITMHHNAPDAITNHPHDPAEVRLADELAEGV